MSEACELTHEIFSVGGGRFARVFVGLAPGWTAAKGAEPSLEDIRDHLGEIRNEEGYIVPAGDQRRDDAVDEGAGMSVAVPARLGFDETHQLFREGFAQFLEREMVPNNEKWEAGRHRRHATCSARPAPPATSGSTCPRSSEAVAPGTSVTTRS